MKHLLLFIALISFAFNARSQELLNADKQKIENYMTAMGGVLKPNLFRFLSHKPKLIYNFQTDPGNNNDVFKMSFYFSMGGKCYKYLTFYKGGKELGILTKRFNKHNSGLKRVPGDLKWQSPAKKYEVGISPVTSTANGKTNTAMLIVYAENTGH